MLELKIGDKVFWESQAGGSSLRKEGSIVYILQANTNPLDVFRDFEKTGLFTSNYGGGCSRTHESYIVAVPPKKGKGKPKLYWPVRNKLKKSE